MAFSCGGKQHFPEQDEGMRIEEEKAYEELNKRLFHLLTLN